MCSRLNCRFVHLTENDKVEVCDQRVAVCRDHSYGQCKRKQCKYYHIPIVLPPANIMATLLKAQQPLLTTSTTTTTSSSSTSISLTTATPAATATSTTINNLNYNNNKINYNKFKYNNNNNYSNNNNSSVKTNDLIKNLSSTSSSSFITSNTTTSTTTTIASYNSDNVNNNIKFYNLIPTINDPLNNYYNLQTGQTNSNQLFFLNQLNNNNNNNQCNATIQTYLHPISSTTTTTNDTTNLIPYNSTNIIVTDSNCLNNGIVNNTDDYINTNYIHNFNDQIDDNLTTISQHQQPLLLTSQPTSVVPSNSYHILSNYNLLNPILTATNLSNNNNNNKNIKLNDKFPNSTSSS